MKKRKITATRTAAELAKALGLTPADGAEIALRSDLNSKIVEVVQRKGLTLTHPGTPISRLASSRNKIPPTVIRAFCVPDAAAGCVVCIPDGLTGPNEADRFFLPLSLLRAFCVPEGFAGRCGRPAQ